jgi:hypothetical protein
LRSEEELVLDKANASNRSAKSVLRKKLEKDPNYQAASPEDQAALLAAELETLAAKRFEACQSSRLSQLFITYLY